MAPRRAGPLNRAGRPTWKKKLKNYLREYGNLNFAKTLVFDAEYIWVTAVLLILAEIVVNVLVIQRIPYTEIDWKAYMQEVEGFLNGTWDYTQLQGDTGPLVYPAGFVYFFSALYYLTGHGENIRVAQYFFAALYIASLILIFRIYSKSKKVPPYVLVFLCCTSYRIHSIYILRLFNDPVAMFFLFLAINLFISGFWSIGSLCYSLAVSMKMNILLFAPALLLAYLYTQGLKGTIFQLGICASIQIVLALPFLWTNPLGYIERAFDLRRVFLFEWTVNWRFLPEDVFVNPVFHISLLVLHILLLVAFLKPWMRFMTSYEKLRNMGVDMISQLFLLPMFTCNFIGIACSRSLHYQFYVWYFHTLPYILWSTPYTVPKKLAILGVIEMCWNTFPSTVLSSAALHACHLLILVGLLRNTSPSQNQRALLDKAK